MCCVVCMRNPQTSVKGSFVCKKRSSSLRQATHTHRKNNSPNMPRKKRNQRNQQTAIAYHSPYMTIHIFKVRTLHFNLLGGARPLKILMTFYEYTCITITTLTYMQQTWRLGKRSGFAHLSWADWSGRTQPPASRVGGLLHCFAEVHCFKRNWLENTG